MEDQIFDPNEEKELNNLATEPVHFSLKNFIVSNKIAISVAAMVILAVGTAAFVVLSRKPPVTPVSNSVVLQMKGPDQISSGNEIEYRVVYRNGENADLRDLTLEVFYPTGFKFKSAAPAPTSSAGSSFNLPLLKQGEQAEVKIRGKLSGATGEDKQLAVKLHYKLSNFNSEFFVESNIHTIILAPSLTLDVIGPAEVINGQDTTFSITYSNVSGQDYENLALSVTFPEGFTLTGTNPPASKDKNYWTLPKLSPGASGKIDISGSFIGDPNQEKLVIGELGLVISNTFAPQISASSGFKIIPSSLSVTVSANPSDVVNLGQTVEFNIAYSNQGSVGMTNVVVIVTLESTILDLSKLQVYNAIVTGNKVTWKSATLSNLALLAPNQRGEMTFTIPVKNNLTSNLKNQIIKAYATISSDQMPKAIKSNDMELKLASQLNLTVTGQYVSGALPMTVGQTTILSLSLLVSNYSNDLENVEVIGSFPLPASDWNNVIVPESEKNNLTYDPNSGKIRWKIGNLPAFSGKFTPAPSVTFQIAVTPTEPDRGKILKLLTDVQASGLDTFINRNVNSELVREVSTSTLDDEDLNQNGTTVK
ncbi:MAG TPA: hypothetical protein VGQ87_01345 [Patescibacteria group bacterium]|jgi:uncharacterized repeat protein (TIGR01451 family)|nr:hypothetical protein [Patescibacteria group bacterium]